MNAKSKPKKNVWHFELVAKKIHMFGHFQKMILEKSHHVLYPVAPVFVRTTISTYWNQGYGYQQGYGPGYGGSNDLPHGYYGYGPGYYYRPLSWIEGVWGCITGLAPTAVLGVDTANLMKNAVQSEYERGESSKR
ncbi:Mucin-21 [Manis pentadactyla]|nr:Mucin-21 [Manis pentadactyla]